MPAPKPVRDRDPTRHALFLAGVVAVAYAVAEWVGLELYLDPQSLAVLWPATGVLVAAFLATPARRWGILLAAAFAGALLRTLLTGPGPSPAGLAAASINPLVGALEGAILAGALRGRARFDAPQAGEVMRFAAGAALVTALGAAVGAAALELWNPTGRVFGTTWKFWWASDALGVLILAPPLLAWWQSPRLEGALARRWREIAALLTATLVVSLAVFSGDAPDSIFEFPYLVLPLLLWAALRFDARIVGVATLMAALVAVGLADAGRGPFLAGGQAGPEQVLALQAFLLVAAVLPLLVLALAEDERRSRAALAESEHRFRSLVETTPDWVWEVDRELHFTYSSPRVRDLLGFTPEEMLGRPVWSTFAPGERERMAEELATRSAAPTRVVQHQIVQQHEDGHRVVTESDAVPVLDAAGALVGYRGIDRDVTARVRAEEEAERHRRELAEADKLISLGTLVSGVAHEINNPNHFIALNLPLLRRAFDEARPVLDRHAAGEPGFRLANIPWAEMRDEIPELIAELLAGSDRIRAIVSELRDYSRRDDAPEHGPVDLNEVVEGALRLLADPISKATRHLSFTPAEGLPPARGNAGRLEQVVINLVQNACQSLEGPERALRLRTAFEAPDQILFELVDEGCGIAPEAQAHVCDPFYTTRREQGGTGLGLALSSRIASEHGGRLELTSVQGQGTTARLWVPRFEPEHEGGIR